MPVESADDLLGFFDPDEFGTPLVAVTAGGSVPFDGIYTDSPLNEQPGTVAAVPVRTPRVITSRAPLAGLLQGDRIERPAPDGTLLGVVNDMQIKGDLLIIMLMDEAW